MEVAHKCSRQISSQDLSLRMPSAVVGCGRKYIQMLPRVQAEKVCSVDDVVGFMIYFPPASHVD